MSRTSLDFQKQVSMGGSTTQLFKQQQDKRLFFSFPSKNSDYQTFSTVGIQIL